MTRKFIFKTLVLCMSLMAISLAAEATERPVQLSLFNPIQIFPEGDAIKGLRFNLLYGKNTSVKGLDLGFVHHNTSGLSKGVQWGFVGINDGDFLGWQSNWVNVTKGRCEGLQWGLFNSAGHASGLQLGFVNYAQTMHGVQIGLINIIKQGGQFPVFPFVNWSF
jgi:hypothetical protein